MTTSEVPTPDEIESLSRETAVSLQMFEQQITSILESRWVSRAMETAWSPSEIAEHVLLSNERLLSAVAARRYQGVSAGWREATAGKENWIRTMLPSAGKAKASVLLSTFAGIEQPTAADRVRSFAGKFDEFLTKVRDAPLHAITWPNTFVGELSAYQWLLYIPFHTRRHQTQLQMTEALLQETEKEIQK